MPVSSWRRSTVSAPEQASPIGTLHLMLLADLVRVSRSVSATPALSEKIALLAGLLGDVTGEEAPIVVSFLAGRPRQRPLGVGHATLSAIDEPPTLEPGLDVTQVDQALEEISAVAGPGSKTRRSSILSDLMVRATDEEQEFLAGLILRNLRQGALEGIMVDAVSMAVGAPAERVRRAAMLEGDLVEVASRALIEGADALVNATLGVLTPVQPMLAKTAATAGEAVEALGRALIEWKLDGARVQVHRDGDRVAVFTRNLRDVTVSLPEIATSALALEVPRFILDGESLLMGPGGRPRDFQQSMSRFGSDDLRDHPPLSAFFFDCLHLDGHDLVDRPLSARREALRSLLPEAALVGSIETDDPKEADAFFEATVKAGYEGVVVKDLSRPYESGRRGSEWMKVKPIITLDLVVLAAEWGSGRRRGWLSNLHLGARLPGDGFVMLGKTFKGLTDEMLRWQTETFLALEESREGHIVHLRPEIVYEIAIDGVQRSTRYPGGVTLRFARVKGHRPDKSPEDVDTLETVRGLLRS